MCLQLRSELPRLCRLSQRTGLPRLRGWRGGAVVGRPEWSGGEAAGIRSYLRLSEQFDIIVLLDPPDCPIVG